ncbi:bifunctional ADP-dependent NAD(P)H-hydrate dehydratase/NAD(P)H-hydrate epimerase [Angustibacter luteus]|uniref:Bifunctional NAD(P)H-hydrate repair enzyme n=1 Tax=Angustibacter luteus TaxID=658456 RepID=A0ABW1JFZ4_9ACTN
MRSAVSVEAVRRAERAAMSLLPEGTLMQRAAAGLAAVVVGELSAARGGVYGARVVLLVGAGANGGDALWAGARLRGRGARVDAVLVAGAVHEEGLAGFRAAGGRVHRVADVPDGGLEAGFGDLLGRADVVVDGILGIGGRPGLDDATAALLDLAAPDACVVAVDLPSGVDPDTGAVGSGAVRADVTVTFGVLKAALLLPPAGQHAGRVELVDIGLDPADLTATEVASLDVADLAAAWPWPHAGDDKYRRGVLGVVAGGRGYTGAAVLCTGAAVRSGAGMVRYVGPDEPTALVRARWPEVVPGDGRVQAWVLGPGLDPDAGDGQADRVRDALGTDLPCLVDAGALDLLPPRRDAPTLLTPHAGELARLLTRLGEPTERADVEARPLEHARAAARLTGATVLLKGATTVVVPPGGSPAGGGPVLTQRDGPAWLATAGSGDVLAGVAGTLLAAGLDPLLAGAVAAAVHGRAGALASAGGPLDAGRLLDAVPGAVAALRDWPT